MKKILIVCIILLSFISVHSPGREIDVNTPKTADFRTSLAHIMSHEGFYSNARFDFGGETYCGISRVYNSGWKGWSYIDKYKWQHGGKIEWNTHIPDKMIDFLVLDYYLDIFIKERFYELKDQSICNHTLDTRLNGVIGGTRLIKKTLTDLGWKLDINNNMDSTTISYINHSNKHIFLKTLEKRRIIFYNNIVRRDSTQKIFLSHWIKRSRI